MFLKTSSAQVSGRCWQDPAGPRSLHRHARPHRSCHPGGPQPGRAGPCRAGQSNQWPADEAFQGLTPEEDWQVPGGYETSLSQNTELGKAVQEAVDELDELGSMERRQLSEAQALLKKLGYKGDLLQSRGAPAGAGSPGSPAQPDG